MTKKLVIFTLMLMAAVGMQAQSLNGTWKTVQNDDEAKIDFYYVFTQSKLTMKLIISQFDPEVGTFTVSTHVPCTYTRNGKKLNVKTNPEQTKINIDKMDFVGEMAEMVKQNPEMKKMIIEALKKSLEESKGNIASELPKGGELEIVTLTAKKLVLRDDSGETMSFTKVR